MNNVSQDKMAPYKKESHARSLLKGISWRFVAFVDTIAVVALVTWLMNGKAAIGPAFEIGVYEFIVKYIVYYVHERIWEQVRSGDGLDKSRTLKKSISWRIVATSMTYFIAGFVLKAGFGGVALAISAVEFFSKFALYYVCLLYTSPSPRD